MQGPQPWIRLVLILFLALLTRVLWAAPPLMEKEVAPAPPLATATTVAPTAAATVNRINPPTYLFSLGTGLAAINDNAGWVLHWGIMVRAFTNLPLYFGPDINVHYWSTSPSSSAVTMMGVQAMASSLIAFDLPGTILRSYLGLSVGPFLRNHGGGPIGWTFSSTARVGMLFLVDDRLSVAVEPRLGLLEGSFALSGVLSAQILL